MYEWEYVGLIGLLKIVILTIPSHNISKLLRLATWTVNTAELYGSLVAKLIGYEYY